MKQFLRKGLLVIWDALTVNFAVLFALWLRHEFGIIPDRYWTAYFNTTLVITGAYIVINYVFGLYRSLWKHASIDELMNMVVAVTCGSAFSIMYGFTVQLLMPRSVYIISWMIILLLLGWSRISYRLLRRTKNIFRQWQDGMKKIMIIGAGEAGSIVINEIKNHRNSDAKPVVVIDDDPFKYRSQIHGVPVLGNRHKIKELAQKKQIDEIIIAIPSAPQSEIIQIVNICKETGCKLRILPAVYDMISGEAAYQQIRDVNIEDLLGRSEVVLNTDEIAGYLKDQVVLVTGGGGSIGSELCRQIARFNPKQLLIFDIYENSAYDLQNELLSIYGSQLNLQVVIGSIRDKERLDEVFSNYHPTVVFHAAAHKHVPLMEDNPKEAVKNNVFGTYNVAMCSHENGVRRFILISTDKAVNPTNIMGATKRMAEMIIQSMNKTSQTEFVAVRFGNVLGSNGSVIPLFKKQIENGGPVTVTHPEITRFFMTIPEAVRLVIQAGAMAKGGEIFVLDMGEPVKIVDLAKDLIRLSGYTPGVDIQIEFTGLRPGEKLYEELLMSEEGLEKTEQKQIFIGRPIDLSFQEVKLRLKMLENCLDSSNDIRQCMAKAVETYVYKKDEVEVG